MVQLAIRKVAYEPPSAEEVRSHLRKLLASEGFDASNRNRRFLSYVVEETLAGRAHLLKGYNIALAVFDRDEKFDPLTDPIVRIEASRLRRSLEHYYLTAGCKDAIGIFIPKGSYAASFTRVEQPSWDDAALDGDGHKANHAAIPAALEFPLPASQSSDATPEKNSVLHSRVVEVDRPFAVGAAVLLVAAGACLGMYWTLTSAKDNQAGLSEAEGPAIESASFP